MRGIDDPSRRARTAGLTFKVAAGKLGVWAPAIATRIAIEPNTNTTSVIASIRESKACNDAVITSCMEVPPGKLGNLSSALPVLAMELLQTPNDLLAQLAGALHDYGWGGDMATATKPPSSSQESAIPSPEAGVLSPAKGLSIPTRKEHKAALPVAKPPFAASISTSRPLTSPPATPRRPVGRSPVASRISNSRGDGPRRSTAEGRHP